MIDPSNASTDAYLSETLCGAVQNGKVTGSTPITGSTSSNNLLSDPLNNSLLNDPYTYGSSYNPAAPIELDVEDAEMAGLNQAQQSSSDDSSTSGTSDASDPNDALPSPMQIMSQGS